MCEFTNACPLRLVSGGDKATREIIFSRKVDLSSVVQVFLIRWKDNPAGALCWQKYI